MPAPGPAKPLFPAANPVFTADGFICFIGAFDSTLDFDPGPGAYDLTARAALQKSDLPIAK